MAIALADKGLVTVFGGSGFLGRHVVRALLKRGWRVRAAVRRPDLAGHLQPLGMVGWVQPIQANLRYRWSVDRAVEGADAVVNLVAILTPVGPPALRRGPRLRRARRRRGGAGAGLDRVVHVSAIGADPESPSGLCAAARRRAKRPCSRRCPKSVVIRPSIVFGPEDHFFNRFAAHGADVAGPAADRRRQDALPAGLRRRRGARHRRCGRGQGEGRARSTNSAGRR